MIGIIGGTGPEGRGLALRFAIAHERVIIGSRNQARSQSAAQEVTSRYPGLIVRGAENLHAAEEADIVILAVPYLSHREVLVNLKDALSGKVVVDVVVPLVFSKGRARVVPVVEGSVAQQAQSLLPG